MGFHLDGRQAPRLAPDLASLLRWRAEHQGDRSAYSFWQGGELRPTEISYAELHWHSQAVARRLLQEVDPGDRALLLFPPGLEFLYAFFGCLQAGVISIPLFPPRRNRKLSRVESVIRDSGARLALTDDRTWEDMRGCWESHALLRTVEGRSVNGWVDGADAGLDDGFDSPGREFVRDLAYLQYTSGSTSSPKGVQVTHRSLMYNCEYMRQAYGLSEDSRSVTWLPHFHDMGLIEGLLNPLYVGFPVVAMSPSRFVQEPLDWLRAITDCRATHSGAPNFAFELCVRKTRPEQLAELDLGSWRTAYSGAEPVRSDTMERFSAYFAPCGFRRTSIYPCYGLAEATLMVTGGDPDADPVVRRLDGDALQHDRAEDATDESAHVVEIVGCGQAHNDMQVVIVDPATKRRRDECEVGEIWVAGPTLADGYWQRPEESADSFAAQIGPSSDPAHGSSSDGQTHQPPGFLRTGDLGFLAAGELFITGRLKDVMIIRGANLYPQDIERVVEKSHHALRPEFGAAFTVEADGEERLVVVFELERSFRKSDESVFLEIASAARNAVYEQFEQELYALQLLKIGGVYKTTSGKIQRQACRDAFLKNELKAIWESRLERRQPRTTPPNRLEKLAGLDERQRCRQVQQMLRSELAAALEVECSQIDPRLPLGSYGLDSLKGGELQFQLERIFDISLPPSTIWNYPTLIALSQFVAGKLCGSPRFNDEAPQVAAAQQRGNK